MQTEDQSERSASSRVLEYFFGGGPRHPSRYRFVEVLSVAAYMWVSWLIAVELFHGLAAMPTALWLTIPTVFAALLWADFVSGFVHWLADTYANATTPFVGPKFVKPFREHHIDPLAHAGHAIFEVQGAPTTKWIKRNAKKFNLSDPSVSLGWLDGERARPCQLTDNLIGIAPEKVIDSVGVVSPAGHCGRESTGKGRAEEP